MPSAPYTKPVVRAGWADTATTGAANDIYDPDLYAGGTVSGGWKNTAIPPARQFMNWVLNYVMDGIRYLCGQGVATWDAAETYVVGATTLGSDNVLYRCILQHTNRNPANNANPTYWQPPKVPTATSPQPTGTVAGFDNSTNVANTNFVTASMNQSYSAAVNWGTAYINSNLINGSPTFTGTPYFVGAAAATRNNGDDTAFLATTSFVHNEIAYEIINGSPALTGTPSAPTAANGTANTQIATTAFVIPGSSIGPRGWRKYPDGMAEQWGTDTVNDSTVTFPSATLFIGIWGVTLGLQGSGTSATVQYNTLTTTGFTTAGGNYTIFWVARGRWF